MLTYTFQHAVRRDPALQAMWDRVARLPSTPAFLAMEAIKGQLPLEVAQKAVACGVPVSKLSWKGKRDPSEIDGILSSLSARPK